MAALKLSTTIPDVPRGVWAHAPLLLHFRNPTARERSHASRVSWRAPPPGFSHPTYAVSPSGAGYLLSRHCNEVLPSLGEGRDPAGLRVLLLGRRCVCGAALQHRKEGRPVGALMLG